VNYSVQNQRFAHSNPKPTTCYLVLGGSESNRGSPEITS
jgi:hypothetical protein